MNMQPTVNELYKNAMRLGPKDLLRLLKKLTILQFKQSGTNVLPDEEAVLLQEVNQVFPPEKWKRLKELDHQMELGELGEAEHAELLRLSEEYEYASVHRLKILSKLSEIRDVSIETLTAQLGIKPNFHV